MVRPRKISDDDVLIGAIGAFWRNGYEATPLPRLEAVTGLNRRGLFNQFGDTQGLFVAALTRFCENATAQCLAPLEAPDAGLDTIVTTLRAIAADSLARDGRPGCLMCNSSRELIAVAAPVRKQLSLFFTRAEQVFGVALANAHTAEDLRDGDDPEALRAYLTGMLLGLFTMVRAGLADAQVNAFVTEACARLR
jgi:TetR/AcrR family transcriptional repressor of nem operon